MNSQRNYYGTRRAVSVAFLALIFLAVFGGISVAVADDGAGGGNPPLLSQPGSGNAGQSGSIGGTSDDQSGIEGAEQTDIWDWIGDLLTDLFE